MHVYDALKGPSTGTLVAVTRYGVYLSSLRKASFTLSIPEDHGDLEGKTEGTCEDKAAESKTSQQNR